MKMIKKTSGNVEYDTNPDFKILMDNINETYQDMLAEANNTNLDKVHSLRIIDSIGIDKNGYQVISFYGMFMPISSEYLQHIYLYFLREMERLLATVETRYQLVYFNTMCSNYKTFLMFKQMFKTLPIKFYNRLDHIIVVHPNFAIRSVQWLSFGMLNYLLSNYIVLADNLQELGVLGILNKLSLERLPKQIIKADICDVKQLKSINTDETKMLRRRISIKNEILGIDYDEYETSEIGVPTLLKMLLSYFIVKPEMTLQEGLFRKNANTEGLTDLQNECRCKNYEYINDVNDPHLICGLIKKLFYHSKNPLFSYAVYAKVISEKKVESFEFIERIIKQMPPLNYRILQFLLEFLKYKVAAMETHNKMNYYNLSVMFAPCLFRPKQYKSEDLLHSVKFIKLLQAIVIDFQKLFGDYQHQSQIYRRSSDQQNEQSRSLLSKRVLKKKYDPSKDKMHHSISMNQILEFD